MGQLTKSMILLLIGYCHSIKPQVPKAVITSNAKAFHVGAAANFTCRLNVNTLSSSDMAFVTKDRKSLRGDTTILNNTTIMQSIKNLTFADNVSIYCSDTRGGDLKALARGKIVVGYPPGKPNEFICTSFHQEYLKCNLTIPTNSGVAIKWTIEYKDSALGGDYKTCPEKLMAESHVVCFLPRQEFFPDYKYTFRVTGSNVLGTRMETYDIEPWLVVKPKSVDRLNASAINSTSLNITWSDEHPFLNPPYQYTITLQANFMEPRQINVTTDTSRETFWVLVSNLVPFSKVVIMIVSKPLEGGYFSDKKMTTILMPMDLPSAPVIPHGSFSTDEAENVKQVTVYWQAVPPELQHGNILRYLVAVYTDEELPPFHREYVEKSSLLKRIQFELNKTSDYNISLQVENEKGLSRKTWLRLPSVNNAVEWVDSEMISETGYNVLWKTKQTTQESRAVLYKCYE